MPSVSTEGKEGHRMPSCGSGDRNSNVHTYHSIWVNYHALTATSLGMVNSRGWLSPNGLKTQVSELSMFCPRQYSMPYSWRMFVVTAILGTTRAAPCSNSAVPHPMDPVLSPHVVHLQLPLHLVGDLKRETKRPDIMKPVVLEKRQKNTVSVCLSNKNQQIVTTFTVSSWREKSSKLHWIGRFHKWR